MTRRAQLALAGLAVALVSGAAVLIVLSPWSDDANQEPEQMPVSEAPGGFVSREGTRLFLDGRLYRFVGVNIPWANNRQTVGCGVPVDDAVLERALDRIGRTANAVRVFFFQSQATFAGERDWSAFDKTLEAIESRGLKVIVTLGEQQGYCADPGGFKSISWYRQGYADLLTPGYPQTYRDYVADVVGRYAGHDEVLAWQLMNEANVVTPEVGCPDEAAASKVLRTWADDVAGLIRSIDPHHLISLGTGLQGGCGYTVTADPTESDYRYVHASPQIDLCEYHDYNAPTVPLPDPQKQEMNTCADLGKAFFVGEVGIEATIPERAQLLGAKLKAQFAYEPGPSSGALVWQYGDPEVGSCDQYCGGFDDPALDVLATR